MKKNIVYSVLVIVLGIFICVIAINPGIVGDHGMEGNPYYEENTNGAQDNPIFGEHAMGPQGKNPVAGKQLEFKTTDMDDNKVDNSIFGEQQLTLLNLWSIHCPPCVEELPELEKIANDYKGKVSVVGIVDDTDMEGVKEVLKKKGVTYTNIIPDKGLQDVMNQFDYIPVTLIVNKEGKVLEKFVPGSSDYEYFKSIITELLDK
ncbi:TlpA family protein disulfide reductase [Vallitalea pronyensis]|uniref:TlpA family protein disulfide reductase n=1 Tax=Vallitalea pronyensis TaxID=1348613 RepID=A0A8J8MKY1_9FIRM|nr:TlpA disulfide reductase family protein [Vallitalea pronyensis]QUI23138.1 TlpA family protein disulfide reductase [Vallitalea pronyensis]